MNIIAKDLRITSCYKLVPEYRKTIGRFRECLPNMPYTNDHKKLLLEKIDAILADPLDALRRQVGEEAERIFDKLGQRKIVMGCMHYPKNSTVDFHETQTPLSDFGPQKIINPEEDHTHADALAIDIRATPDAAGELRFTALMALKATTIRNLSAYSPDFAGRDLATDLEDFHYVNMVEKIYIERVPFFMYGPQKEAVVAASNLHTFKALHQMMSHGGRLSFDFSPLFCVYDHQEKNASFTCFPREQKREVTQGDIEEYLEKSPFSDYFRNLPEDYAVPFLASFDPARTIKQNMVVNAINYIRYEEEMKQRGDKTREEVKSQPHADLTMQEVFIQINYDKFSLKDEVKHKGFDPAILMIKCNEKRTQQQVDSINFQFECYRVLNLDPSLEAHISIETKKVLDLSYTVFVGKVVFPRLEALGFQRVKFSPNGVNPENGRPFDRVVHAKKL